MLAAAIFSEPDFLLLDEPTNNLDRDGRRAVIDLLSGCAAGDCRQPRSRTAREMDAIIELTSLGTKRYGGGWSAYQAARAVELEAAPTKALRMHRRPPTKSIARHVPWQSGRTGVTRLVPRKAAKGDMPRILLGRRKSSAEESRGRGVELAERQRAGALEASQPPKRGSRCCSPFPSAFREPSFQLGGKSSRLTESRQATIPPSGHSRSILLAGRPAAPFDHRPQRVGQDEPSESGHRRIAALRRNGFRKRSSLSFGPERQHPGARRDDPR